jgi:hypothetical protein
MKVFVVMFNEYYQYEYDQSTLRKVFDSMEKAEAYIAENSSEVIDKAYQDHNFEVIEREVE